MSDASPVGRYRSAFRLSAIGASNILQRDLLAEQDQLERLDSAEVFEDYPRFYLLGDLDLNVPEGEQS